MCVFNAKLCSLCFIGDDKDSEELFLKRVSKIHVIVFLSASFNGH